MGRISVNDLKLIIRRTEELLRRAGELEEDEILYVSQETAGCPWQVFVRRRHMAGPQTGHPVIGWFGHGGWLGRTKKEAHRDLQRTNAALFMYLRRVGKLTE